MTVQYCRVAEGDRFVGIKSSKILFTIANIAHRQWWRGDWALVCILPAGHISWCWWAFPGYKQESIPFTSFAMLIDVILLFLQGVPPSYCFEDFFKYAFNHAKFRDKQVGHWIPKHQSCSEQNYKNEQTKNPPFSSKPNDNHTKTQFPHVLVFRCAFITSTHRDMKSRMCNRSTARLSRSFFSGGSVRSFV